MNINPFKGIVSNVRSSTTETLPSPSVSQLQKTIDALVTHIQQVTHSSPKSTEGANPSSLTQFIVTINVGSKSMDVITDIPMTVGEALALTTNAKGEVHLVNRTRPPQPELIKALIADLANRQDSLIPLLKTLSTIMNNAQITPLKEVPSIQTQLEQPLTEAGLKTLADTIKAHSATLKGSITPTPPPNTSNDQALNITHPMADQFKAITTLQQVPRWPDIAATLMALQQIQVGGPNSPDASQLKKTIQALTVGTSLTLTQQISPPPDAQPASNTNATPAQAPSMARLLFRLVALLEVSAAEAADPSLNQTSKGSSQPWYSSWQSLHPKGWAPSLPALDAPHLPWLPPMTQLQAIRPQSDSSQTPTPNWLEGMVKVLMQQSTAALARLSTQQLLHHQNRQEPTSPNITQVEIPLQWNNQWTQANLHIREDQLQHEQTPEQFEQVRQWSLNLSFNFDPIGVVIVQFTLQNQVSRGTVWIEKPNTFHAANSLFQHFLDQLKSIGIQERDWSLQQGLPPDQAPAITTQLVDIKT